jgi:hypothetical protein
MLEDVIKSIINVTPDKQKKPVLYLNSRVNQALSLGRGKDYPGFKPLLTYRALAWNSTIVYSIIIFRRNQVLKKEKIVVPYNNQEPTFRFSILEYSPESLLYLPSIDEADAIAILKLYRKYKNSDIKEPFTIQNFKNKLNESEKTILNHIEEKHIEYYLNRIRDTKKIINFLNKPDPYFSEVNNWEHLLSMVLDDILTIDRGTILKVRDDRGKLISLVPVDGTTIKPVVNENNGVVENYVQEVDGAIVNEYIDKKDIILFRQNITPDVYMYGYSIAPIEILYKAILSDIFIDKGNLDYYRKGGSIPEGVITIEPPSVKDGDVYPQLSREQLESIQRQLQAIMMGDYTQVPILSGGKFTWIDFKGKRRDMQFKELAEYVSRKICAVYQVSPQDVGITSDVNRATAEVMASMTKAKGLEPLLANISRGFDSVIDEFRPQRDIKLWFKEDDLEKEKEWWSSVQGMLNSGFRTINELRMEKGLDPVPWGDAPFSGLRNWEPPKPEENKESPGSGIPGGALGGMPGMDMGGMQGILGGAPNASSGPGGGAGASGGLGGLESLLNTPDVGQDQGAQGLDALKQMLQKSFDVKDTVELINDNNYLNDEELLKRVLKTIGSESIVEFISNDLENDLEVTPEELIQHNFNSKISNGKLVIGEGGLLEVHLLANSNFDFDYKKILELMSLHYDCSSLPKISIESNEIDKFSKINLHICTPMQGNIVTLLDKLNRDFYKKPDVLYIHSDQKIFEEILPVKEKNNLILYSLLPEDYKENNFNKLVEIYGYDEYAFLFSPNKYIDLIKEEMFSNEELKNRLSCVYGPLSLFAIAKATNKYGENFIMHLLNSKNKQVSTITKYVLLVNSYDFEKEYNEEDIKLDLLENENNFNLNKLYANIYIENLEEAIEYLINYLHSINEDSDYEFSRFLNIINYVIFEQGNQEIATSFISKLMNVDQTVDSLDFFELVEKCINNIKNPITKSLVRKHMLGEKLEKEEYKLIEDYVTI